MSRDDEVWVELECRMTEYRMRTFRGRTSRLELETIVNGGAEGFIRLAECYRYNDPDLDAETGKPVGTYQRLGLDEYTNFTGEMHLRASTISNIAYLKRGFDGEPAPDLSVEIPSK